MQGAASVDEMSLTSSIEDNGSKKVRLVKGFKKMAEFLWMGSASRTWRRCCTPWLSCSSGRRHAPGPQLPFSGISSGKLNTPRASERQLKFGACDRPWLEHAPASLYLRPFEPHLIPEDMLDSP